MNELVSYQNLGLVQTEYKRMIEHINASMPAAINNAESFHKSKSQYSTATIDNTSLTPMRTVKQILAEITRTRHALEEASISTNKKKIELKKHQTAVSNDMLDIEMSEIECIELKYQIANVEDAMKGAIRKLSFLLAQHDAILKSLGKTEITEEDYEKEEARAHVMIAFKQALCAARSRGGIIDEGNHIYLFDIGIPGAQAQMEVLAYLKMEEEMFKQGKSPTHEMTMTWLNACADKFSECGYDFARLRLLKTEDSRSLIS